MWKKKIKKLNCTKCTQSGSDTLANDVDNVKMNHEIWKYNIINVVNVEHKRNPRIISES